MSNSKQQTPVFGGSGLPIFDGDREPRARLQEGAARINKYARFRLASEVFDIAHIVLGPRLELVNTILRSGKRGTGSGGAVLPQLPGTSVETVLDVVAADA